MGVRLEVQFSPLEFEGSVSPLRSFLDFLKSSVDIRVMSAPVSRRASTLRCCSIMMER